MLRSLRAQLGAIFLGFLLLVSGSVAATFLAQRTQADDATVIHLAGRQRMLTQRMIWLAVVQPDSPELAASTRLFDQTLRALRDGGVTRDAAGRPVRLPPAPDPALQAQLDEVGQTWATFRAHLPPRDDIALQPESSLIVAQLDGIVSAFEARTQTQLARLQLLQLVFIVGAFQLLAWGYFLTRRRILQPLEALGAAARRLAAGQRADPIPTGGDDELGQLSRAFESMRVEVAAAHDQLESRVRQRTRELASAFELSQEIVAQLEPEHLLQSVADRARALTRARTAALCLLDEDQAILRLAASSGEGRHPRNLRQSFRRHPLQRVVGAHETVVTEAICTHCSFLLAHAPGQCAAAPLRAGETALGALCVVRGEHERFDPDETRALTLLANSAAIAISNARLAEAGRRQAEEAAILAERERLAADLHDHLAQTLGFLSLKAEGLRERLAPGQAGAASGDLARMQAVIGEAYGQVRAALVGLREPPPVTDNVAQKLAACLADFRAASGLLAELEITDPSTLTLSQVAQVQVVHIVREALTNARRHARAGRVRVRAERTNGEVRFTVEDNGDGFDPQAIGGNNHLGLAIMRARAERSGGDLRLESSPGAGTKIILSFPLIRDK